MTFKVWQAVGKIMWICRGKLSRLIATAHQIPAAASRRKAMMGDFKRSTMDNDITVNNFDGFLPRVLDRMGLVGDGNLAYVLFVELALQYNMLGYCFVPFTYRYFHMVWKIRFTNSAFALLVLVYITPMTLFSFIMAYLAGNTYFKMTQLVSAPDPNCMRNLPYYDNMKYPAEPYAAIFSSAVIPLLWTMVAPLFQVFFIWRIYTYLNNDVRKSDFYRKMQRQITRTLTAQSVIPLIFIAIPLFFVAFALGYDFTKDLSLRVFYTSLAIVPLANPLSTILLVKNFRLTVTDAITATQQRMGSTMMMSTGSGVVRRVSVKQRGWPRNGLDGRRSYGSG
uniref:Uncharacterized protein n=1 Tax=Bursaphelenchus xylophilus TaxID=6326 RepID=A0A1I7SHA1_BURXY